MHADLLEAMAHEDFAMLLVRHAEFEEGRGNREAAMLMREAATRVRELEADSLIALALSSLAKLSQAFEDRDA